MPSPARTAARRRWRRWSEATSSSSRWTTAAAGIAITISSPTCSGRTCWTSSPTTSPDLHRRASEWYEQNGEPSEAIRHALAAEDFERAADLVERAVPAMRQEPTGGHAARLAQGAARRAGRRQARAQRRLCRGVAGQRRARGRRGPPAGRRTVAGRDGRAGRATDVRPAMVVVDDEEFRRLPGAIAVYRAGHGPGCGAMWPAP